jgi:hypothetical protein
MKTRFFTSVAALALVAGAAHAQDLMFAWARAISTGTATRPMPMPRRTSAVRP